MPVALFDLDGTITDPRFGITLAYQQMVAEYGLPVPKTEELLWAIGPALRECLPQIVPVKTPEEIEQAVARYRYFYVTKGAMYKDTPYEGIRQVLEQLRDQGVELFVATAKAHAYAAQILAHWKLKEFFTHVYGSELDGTRSNKAELLAYLLTEENIIERDRCVMIGDRHHDINASVANGLSSIGVTYGYGSSAELTEAGATTLCHSPGTIVEAVRKIIRV